MNAHTRPNTTHLVTQHRRNLMALLDPRDPMESGLRDIIADCIDAERAEKLPTEETCDDLRAAADSITRTAAEMSEWLYGRAATLERG